MQGAYQNWKEQRLFRYAWGILIAHRVVDYPGTDGDRHVLSYTQRQVDHRGELGKSCSRLVSYAPKSSVENLLGKVRVVIIVAQLVHYELNCNEEALVLGCDLEAWVRNRRTKRKDGKPTSTKRVSFRAAKNVSQQVKALEHPPHQFSIPRPRWLLCESSPRLPRKYRANVRGILIVVSTSDAKRREAML